MKEAVCEHFFSDKAEAMFSNLRFEGSFDGDRTMGAVARLVSCHRLADHDALTLRLQKLGAKANDLSTRAASDLFSGIFGDSLPSDMVSIYDLACLVSKKMEIIRVFDKNFLNGHPEFSENYRVRECIEERCHEPIRVYTDERNRRAVVIVGHMTQEIYLLLTAVLPALIPSALNDVKNEKTVDWSMLVESFRASSSKDARNKLLNMLSDYAGRLGLSD